MSKRILSLALVVFMLLLMLPTGAVFAAGESPMTAIKSNTDDFEDSTKLLSATKNAGTMPTQVADPTDATKHVLSLGKYFRIAHSYFASGASSTVTDKYFTEYEFDFYADELNNTTDMMLGIRINGANTYVFGIDTTDTANGGRYLVSGYKTRNTDYEISKDTWYTFKIVYDDKEDTARVYVKERNEESFEPLSFSVAAAGFPEYYVDEYTLNAAKSANQDPCFLNNQIVWGSSTANNQTVDIKMYIDNFTISHYNEYLSALNACTTATEVKAVLDFYSTYGYFNYGDDEIPNGAYDELIGKSFITKAAVQTAWDAYVAANSNAPKLFELLNAAADEYEALYVIKSFESVFTASSINISNLDSYKCKQLTGKDFASDDAVKTAVSAALAVDSPILKTLYYNFEDGKTVYTSGGTIIADSTVANSENKILSLSGNHWLNVDEALGGRLTEGIIKLNAKWYADFGTDSSTGKGMRLNWRGTLGEDENVSLNVMTLVHNGRWVGPSDTWSLQSAEQKNWYDVSTVLNLDSETFAAKAKKTDSATYEALAFPQYTEATGTDVKVYEDVHYLVGATYNGATVTNTANGTPNEDVWLYGFLQNAGSAVETDYLDNISYDIYKPMHDALSNQSAEKVEEYLALYEEINSFVPEYDAESGIDMDVVYDGMKNQTYVNDAAVIAKYNELCEANLPEYTINLNIYQNDIKVGYNAYDKGNFKAEIEFKNNQKTVNENIFVIAALFNSEDDTLITANVGRGVAPAKDTGKVCAELNITNTTGTYMKIYVWDSVTLVPYIMPIDLNPV